ncbi:MAG TPA: pyridoxal-phosphate dependent enzyme [Candidatus Marinimicrobia bacterium]|nr:pyridoxal-phosphate dependent enzyme [Candidatus Neomarinimicrobiota bacterium]
MVAETAGRRYASENGVAYVSPYNDPEIVAGQGTVGVELIKQLPDVEALFVSLGGGGTYLRHGRCHERRKKCDCSGLLTREFACHAQVRRSGKNTGYGVETHPVRWHRRRCGGGGHHF